MSYESSHSQYPQNGSSSSHKDMTDQEALDKINNEISNEKFQSMIQQGNTTSFSFSNKNRVGSLARILKVFQEYGIKVLHVESRSSDRGDFEYEIFVDLEADQTRIKQSLKNLKKQLSCVEFDSSTLLPSEENIQDELIKASATPLDTPNQNLSAALSFIDHDQQAIKHKSRWHTKKKLIK